MKKDSKSKWAEFGNFLIGLEENRNGKYVVIKTASGSWCMKYRDDCEMYGNLLIVINDERLHPYLERIIVSYYTHTTHLHDFLCLADEGVKEKDGDGKEKVNFLPFLTKYWKLVNEEVERERGYMKKPTVEEDENALKEVAEMEEIADIIEQENNE